MNRDLVIAPTLTSAKQYVPRRLAPASSPSSTANTPAHNSGDDSANSFALHSRTLKRLFRQNAETSTLEVCAPQNSAIGCRTRTSTVLDPFPFLRAWPIDQHLTRRAVP